MKKIALLFILMIPVCVFAGSVSTSKTTVNVEVGSSTSFNVEVTNAAGRFEIKSSDTSVSTITMTSNEATQITGGYKLWLESTDTNKVSEKVTVAGKKIGSTTIKFDTKDVASFDSEELINKSITVNVNVNAVPQPVFKLSKLTPDSNKRLLKVDSVGEKIDSLFTTTENNKYLEIYSASDVLLYSKTKTDTTTVMATGQYVKYYDENKANKITYKITIYGDVNGDGSISSLDYVKVKNHIMDTKKIEGAEYVEAADYNFDSKISSLDYVKIKNLIMKK